MNYKRSTTLESSFLIPIAVSLIACALCCLVLTLLWRYHIPLAQWPAEGEADQFEVMRRIEACGILILLMAAVRRKLLNDDSSFLSPVRDALNAGATLFQICCATLGMTNGGIYLLNLLMSRISGVMPPVQPFPMLPLLFLACGLFVSLIQARSDSPELD
jgi:hypothetical protein